MTFRELEHTADVRIRVEAGSLEELFSEAARALMTIMYGVAEEGGLEESIEVSAGDREALMHSFLSEVLFLSEVRDIVVSGARVTIVGNDLAGTLLGEPFSQEKHSSGMEVKGISLSGLSIAHDHDSYTLEVNFDV
ncbi:MAG: archease [Methanoregulaceae archaeon]|nr:archease [Methanoregulaceae archaeon]